LFQLAVTPALGLQLPERDKKNRPAARWPGGIKRGGGRRLRFRRRAVGDRDCGQGIQGARQLAKPPGRSAGYRVGGISPFAQRKRVPVAIEETALRESTVFLNGGQRGLQIELAPDDARAALDAIACPLTS